MIFLYYTTDPRTFHQFFVKSPAILQKNTPASRGVMLSLNYRTDQLLICCTLRNRTGAAVSAPMRTT